MFKTTYRDLAATLCGTLGLLTIAVSLILTPLPAWGDDGLPGETGFICNSWNTCTFGGGQCSGFCFSYSCDCYEENRSGGVLYCGC